MINNITIKAWIFMLVYVILAVLLSFFLVIAIIAFIVFLIAFLTEGVAVQSMTGYIRQYFSFDFSPLKFSYSDAVAGPAIEAAFAAWIGLGCLLTATIFGIALKIFKKCSNKKRQITALLPGRGGGYIPADEGIYKLSYNNLITKNKFYKLFPWEILHLHKIDDKKRRVFLKLKTIKICLEGNHERAHDYYDEMKEIVSERLPEQNRKLPAKPDRFKWWLVAALLISTVILGRVGASLFLNASDHVTDDEMCDIGGKTHVYTSFSYNGYTTLKIMDDEGRLTHTYCLLHAGIFLSLHPVEYVRTIRNTVRTAGFGAYFAEYFLFLFNLILPLYVWFYLLLIIISAARPKILRFHML